jgi:heme exporter protein CcmD
MDIKDFFYMDGYARFVWPAYALTAAVLLLNVVLALRSRRSQLESARRRNLAAPEGLR